MSFIAYLSVCALPLLLLVVDIARDPKGTGPVQNKPAEPDPLQSAAPSRLSSPGTYQRRR